MVNVSGSPKRQQISLNVNLAKLSEEVGSLAAAATIVLEVLSTQVTIHSFPDLDLGRGPTKSIAHDVKGCKGIVEKDSLPKRCWLELLDDEHTQHERTKCATSDAKPGQ